MNDEDREEMENAAEILRLMGVIEENIENLPPDGTREITRALQAVFREIYGWRTDTGTITWREAARVLLSAIDKVLEEE